MEQRERRRKSIPAVTPDEGHGLQAVGKHIPLGELCPLGLSGGAACILDKYSFILGNRSVGVGIRSVLHRRHERFGRSVDHWFPTWARQLSRKISRVLLPLWQNANGTGDKHAPQQREPPISRCHGRGINLFH